MTPTERLAAVLAQLHSRPRHPADLADSILAADPTLAQDIADGQALRELVAALGPRSWVKVLSPDPAATGNGWEVDVWGTSPRQALTHAVGPTLAAAATAAREALGR